jgi:hypothetical protein
MNCIEANAATDDCETCYGAQKTGGNLSRGLDFFASMPYICVDHPHRKRPGRTPGGGTRAQRNLRPAQIPAAAATFSGNVSGLSAFG